MAHPLVPLIIIGAAVAIGLGTRKKGDKNGGDVSGPAVEFVDGCTRVVVRDQARADAEWDATVDEVIRFNPEATPANAMVRWLESVRNGPTCMVMYTPVGDWATPAVADFPSLHAAAIWLLFYNRMIAAFVDRGMPVNYDGFWEALSRYGLTEADLNAVPVEYP
jgi:hypothetical protein